MPDAFTQTGAVPDSFPAFDTIYGWRTLQINVAFRNQPFIVRMVFDRDEGGRIPRRPNSQVPRAT